MIHSFHPYDIWHMRFISFSMINLFAEWYDTILKIFTLFRMRWQCWRHHLAASPGIFFLHQGHYCNLNLWKINFFILNEGAGSRLTDRHVADHKQGRREIGVALGGGVEGRSWPCPITLTHFRQRDGAALCDCVTRGHSACEQKPGPGLIQSPVPLFLQSVRNVCQPLQSIPEEVESGPTFPRAAFTRQRSRTLPYLELCVN